MSDIDKDLPEAVEDFAHSDEGTATEVKADTQNWDVERDGRMADYATDEADEPLTVCPHSEEADEVGEPCQDS